MRRSLSRSRTRSASSPRQRTLGVENLEYRQLLSTATAAGLTARPMFALGPLVSNTSPPGGAYTPTQIRQAYGFNQVTFGAVQGDGSGQTIAIVDAYSDPNIQADLNVFDTKFGLPAATITRVDQTGGTNYPTADSGGGWSLETALDVEWAHAIAPGAHILLVEANSSYLSDLLPAVTYAASRASVVSMSWGGGEFGGENGYDSNFVHPGTTFVASSGDAGAPISWPAASPDVLAVGGTALSLGANNTYASESGWSGSGGGPSAYESKPSYQSAVTGTTRSNPDVSYDASPSTGFAVYDSVPYNGTAYGWIQVGGTSAGAPQWAALVAIADQGRALSGQAAINATNPQEILTTLYANTAAFHDVKTGTSVGTPQYTAGPGYDYVTGIGSPIAALVVQALDGSTTNPNPSNDQLVLTAPATDVAGASFGLTVTAKIPGGGTDTAYQGVVHFTATDVQAGLPADYTFTTADAGSHTFTVVLKTSGGQSLTATDVANSAITGTSSAIAVGAAAFKTLSVSGFPATTAGVPQTFTVTAVDAYGNTVTSYADPVRFNSLNWQNVLPALYTFTTADAGTHTFSATLKVAGTKSISVQDQSVWISGVESGIVVSPAAMKGFSVSSAATTSAGTALPVVVTAVDAFGNTITNYAGTVQTTTGDRLAVLPPNYAFTTADAGSHTFNVTFNTVGNWSINATDTANPSLTGVRWLNVTASTGPAAVAVGFVESSAATTVAGASLPVVVTAVDSSGAAVPNYVGTVHFASGDPKAGLPADYTFTAIDAGSHTFNVTLDTAGAQSVAVNDVTNTALTAVRSIGVSAAPASVLAITGLPTSTVVGVPLAFTVTADDAYGNQAVGYTGTVHFVSGDVQASLPADYTFTTADAGAHTFSVTLKTAGNQSVGVNDTTNTALSAVGSMNATAGAASVLAITGLPTSTMIGVARAFTVTADDAYGNQAVGYTGTVHFVSGDVQAILPADYTFTTADAGSHTFSVTMKTAGTWSVGANDTTDTALSAVGSINVTATVAGPVKTLSLSGFPATTAGVPQTFTVTALDANGNVATGYTGTVRFNSLNWQNVLPALYTFTTADAGSHTFTATLKIAGTKSISVQDQSIWISAAESGIVVSPAAMKGFSVSSAATTYAGASLPVVVTAIDAFGNTIPNYAGTVHLSTGDAQALLPADYTFTTLDAGSHTFAVTLKTVGNWSIAAKDLANPALNGVRWLNATAAPANVLEIVGLPSPASVGSIRKGSLFFRSADGHRLTSHATIVY